MSIVGNFQIEPSYSENPTRQAGDLVLMKLHQILRLKGAIIQEFFPNPRACGQEGVPATPSKEGESTPNIPCQLIEASPRGQRRY